MRDTPSFQSITGWRLRPSCPRSSKTSRCISMGAFSRSELFRIEPNRVAVVGHSAGGSGADGGIVLKPCPKAIVSFYGYGDIAGAV